MSDSILGWLGFRRHDDGSDGSDGAGAALTPQERGRKLRGRMVEAIGEFLVDHDLAITPHNLAIAHGAVSGLNPRLRRKIASQQAAGAAITQEWLDLATASEAGEEDKAGENLIKQLEETLSQFKRTTQTAQTNSREYGDALAQHVDQLEAVPDTGEMISELAEYARAMLQRSRRVEAELRQSEEEAAGLRNTLDRARRDAEIDFLTGLPNRRAFEAELERNFAEAQAAGEPLCIAFCDIDHFKAVNDTHGHDAGDRVICVVAKTLSDISGERCHIARHGGEEFVVLFRGSHLLVALEMLDGARAALAAKQLVNRRTNLPFGQITFSGGIADVFAYGSPSEALAAADEALYRAKEGGRNRIEMATPELRAAA
ncbi:MAG: GGDEF domain-containing protein [Alteraurantiacibacter sp.]